MAMNPYFVGAHENPTQYKHLKFFLFSHLEEIKINLKMAIKKNNLKKSINIK